MTSRDCFDLFTPTEVVLKKGLNKIKLRIKIQLPENTFGSIRCRSSLAKYGILEFRPVQRRNRLTDRI